MVDEARAAILRALVIVGEQPYYPDTHTGLRQQWVKDQIATRLEALLMDGVRELSTEEGRALVDRQARKYLGISGEEFVRRYEAGELGEDDHDDVARIAMLIPMTKDPAGSE